MTYTVGIGEMAISNQPGDRIITHALGSCVAVTVFCKETKIAGMIHVALPSKPLNASVSMNKPAYYADDGIENFTRALSQKGCYDFNKAIIQLIGGANPTRMNDYFMVGKRNLEAVKRILLERQLKFIENDIGGNVSRTVEMDVATGLIQIKSQPLII